jgi:hypothetical protein
MIKKLKIYEMSKLQRITELMDNSKELYQFELNFIMKKIKI